MFQLTTEIIDPVPLMVIIYKCLLDLLYIYNICYFIIIMNVAIFILNMHNNIIIINHTLYTFKNNYTFLQVINIKTAYVLI